LTSTNKTSDKVTYLQNVKHVGSVMSIFSMQFDGDILNIAIS